MENLASVHRFLNRIPIAAGMRLTLAQNRGQPLFDSRPSAGTHEEPRRLVESQPGASASVRTEPVKAIDCCKR
jgi:hypothetical protein